MKKIAVVTGASSGMGKEFVFQIAEKYSALEEIWVIARREKRLKDLERQIKGIKIRPFVLDLEKEESFQYLKEALEKEKPRVCILANGSGVGYAGRFDDLQARDISKMISLDCNGLTRVTYQVLPFMERGSYLYQFASSAAFAPQPGFSVYAAAKSYVLSFSLALREEVKGRGIRVTAVCPGPVKTEFFETAYKNQEMKFFKKQVMVSPQKVVAKALKDGKRNKGISVCGIGMKLTHVVCKIVPSTWIAKIMGS